MDVGLGQVMLCQAKGVFDSRARHRLCFISGIAAVLLQALAAVLTSVGVLLLLQVSHRRASTGVWWKCWSCQHLHPLQPTGAAPTQVCLLPSATLLV